MAITECRRLVNDPKKKPTTNKHTPHLHPLFFPLSSSFLPIICLPEYAFAGQEKEREKKWT